MYGLNGPGGGGRSKNSSERNKLCQIKEIGLHCLQRIISYFKKIKRFFSICLYPDALGTSNQPTTNQQPKGFSHKVLHCSPVTCSWKEEHLWSWCKLPGVNRFDLLNPGLRLAGEQRDNASSYRAGWEQGEWGSSMPFQP